MIALIDLPNLLTEAVERAAVARVEPNSRQNNGNGDS
jgi:hypothetical protein